MNQSASNRDNPEIATQKSWVAPVESLPRDKRREVHRRYRQTVNLLRPELHKALEEGEEYAIARIAHQLAGGAAVLGHNDLANLACQAVIDAGTGELASARELLYRLGKT